MKKVFLIIMCVVAIIIIIAIAYYGWLYYRATKLISGLDTNTSELYKVDLGKYNQAINADDISFCESINTSAVFNNGENIKIRCEDSIYFNEAFKMKDGTYCEKMSLSSPMRQNCFEFSAKK